MGKAEPIGTESLITHWGLSSIFHNSVYVVSHRDESTHLHSGRRAPSLTDAVEALPPAPRPTWVTYIQGQTETFPGHWHTPPTVPVPASFLLCLRIYPTLLEWAHLLQEPMPPGTTSNQGVWKSMGKSASSWPGGRF